MSWALVLLLGCGAIKDYMPEGPVMGLQERLARFPGEVSSGVAYTGEPRVDVPVHGVQIFGVIYDLDLVLQSRHPDWDMHEYARVVTADGPLWLAKDARAPAKTQSIVADIDGIDRWLPEVPVERKQGAVEVEDRSTEDWLDLTIRYDNLDGEPVEVVYEGRMPDAPESKRNGSTLGHSRDAIAAVLDVSHREFARRASITIGGEPQRLKKVLGLVAVKLVLAQTQGGFSSGQWTVSRAETGEVQSVHASGAVQTWDEQRGAGWLELTQRGELREVVYRFLERDGAQELVSARVRQHAQSVRATHVMFHPAVPDLRRPFEGEVRGQFVVDVGGQLGHGTGEWVATWEDDGPRLALRGAAPSWLADRPMDTVIRFEDGAALVEASMVAVP